MENNYKVYCHLFPNGKRYIGITKQRLAIRFKNGYGYQRCPIMWKAIQKYKWENIEHNVLFENLTKEEAERQTGISYKSISDSCRKNKTIYGLHWEFVKKEDK